MKKILFASVSICLCLSVLAQQTMQERLDYAKDTKLLIIHADDLGVSHSEDSASLHALDEKYVSSASIMVPTPWLTEIANYSKQHPNADLGLHLTLTSEWNAYKWGSVAPRDKVSSLLDSQGYFYDNTDSLGKKASVEEVETELRSQIEKALHAGIHITHLDSHMGSVFFKKDFFKVYLKLAREYHLPCLMNVDVFKLIYHVDISDMLTNKDVVTDHVYMATPPNNPGDRSAFYTGLLNNLPMGLSCLIIHAAYNDDEMKAITKGHPDYGAAWRQADYDFFSSDACKKVLADNHIHVITWKEIKDKLMQ